MEKSRKRKNKAYYVGSAKKKKSHAKYGPGYSGFLITCDCKKEKFAILEAYSLLNEFADKLYGPEEVVEESHGDFSSEEDSDLDVEASMKTELKAIKNLSKQERRFQALDTKAKHNIFIRANVENVNLLAETIFNDLLETGVKKSRHCMRFLPVKQTCYASVDKIAQTSKKIIEDLVKERNGLPFSVHVQVKERFNNSIAKETVIPHLLEIISKSGEDNKAVLKNGDFILDINILRSTCAVSLLRDYDRFKKYNLQSCQTVAIENPLLTTAVCLEENGAKAECKEQKTEDDTMVLIKDERSGDKGDFEPKSEEIVINRT